METKTEKKKRVRALEVYKSFGKEYIYFPKGTTEKEAQMFGYRRALKKGMKCSDVKVDKEFEGKINGENFVYRIFFIILEDF